MEQETRNKLQRATQQIRRLLEEEFAEQLEGTFDILASGKILPSAGKHLDARQRLTRQKLVDAIEHIKAGGKQPQEAVEEYTREAAFTFLNRFVALRMLEARGLLQECVSNGDQSSGFKEFCGLAPGLASLPDCGYRLYLECLCDELSVEIKVLFDRRDSANLLWPRRGALTELLDVLDQTELAGVWSENETIGWVYQYFNSGEERKKMRDESQAPRNSRELAVRNQFFTPLYVVEFLTDNTLGRIWYEMQKGKTRLANECRFLVRRPREVFLIENQEPPAEDIDAEKDLSQQELLEKREYIPHRAKKDPRDLKILDPACGSGHFLLYAFELLVAIYEEAFYDEGSPKSELTGRRLRDDYPTLEDLHAALPGLVLAHNLHGIDIDPRAVQIAALALWLRGQRAFNDFRITRAQRPRIARSNIVCAEPMPGEMAFLDEFISKHMSSEAEDRFLASLVRKVFESMRLAGEAGSLLKVEEDIADEVAKAKKQWLERSVLKQKTLFSDGPTALQRKFDLTRGITDASFWDEVEPRIYEALRAYSEAAEQDGGFQRKLFASDTVRGFAFIDLARQRYHTILMNPPFGDAPPNISAYVGERYTNTKSDLATAFADRYIRLLAPKSRLGILSSRTWLFAKSFQAWREELLDHYWLSNVADLGYGVLDAVVETAAITLENSRSAQKSMFVSALRATDKATAICTSSEHTWISSSLFRGLNGSVFAYWIPHAILARYLAFPHVDDAVAACKQGLASADDFRFFRLSWEVPPQCFGLRQGQTVSSIDGWMPIAKGGEYRPFYDDLHLLVDWRKDGASLKAFPRSYVRSPDLYFKPGLTWSYRTTSAFCLKVLPAHSAFTHGGWGLFPAVAVDPLDLLAGFNSLLGRYFMELQLGQGDTSASGTAARNYGAEPVAAVPFIELRDKDTGKKVIDLVERQRSRDRQDETSRIFSGLQLSQLQHGVSAVVNSAHAAYLSDCLDSLIDTFAIQNRLEASFGTNTSELEAVYAQEGHHPCSYDTGRTLSAESRTLYEGSEEALIAAANEKTGGGRFAVKKAYFVDRRIELLCHVYRVHPEVIVRKAIAEQWIPSSEVREWSQRILSYFVGVAFGRWDISRSTAESSGENYGDIFAPLPLWRPGALVVNSCDQNDLQFSADGILTDDPGAEFDMHRYVIKSIERVCGDSALEVSRELASIVKKNQDLGGYIRQNLFNDHIARYSKSRRSGPIYWQLSTASASYSVWLYYDKFRRDSLFRVSDEYVKRKRDYERQKLDRMRSDAGAEPTRGECKAIEEQETFVNELAAMAFEVEQIAPLWNPNLNDGVIINFAPLWRLVPQNKAWQKECKECWDQLVLGEYDWSHLAMHLWPERVVPKCVDDASIAIAHGLEDAFWQQDERERFLAKPKPDGGWQPVIERLVNERTSPAVKAALKSLLEAPTAAAPARKSRARKGTAS
jgi:hypothetical protein